MVSEVEALCLVLSTAELGMTKEVQAQPVLVENCPQRQQYEDVWQEVVY